MLFVWCQYFFFKLVWKILEQTAYALTSILFPVSLSEKKN